MVKFNSIVAFAIFIQASYLILSLFEVLTFEIEKWILAIAFAVIGGSAILCLLKSPAAS